MQNLKRTEETTGKGDKRDSSIASKHSSSSKFLKRKPDVKKIISGKSGVKKKENQVSEYFESEIFLIRRNNYANLQDCKSQGDKFNAMTNETDGSNKAIAKESSKRLQKVKSEKNIPLIYKEFESGSNEDRLKDKSINDKISQFKISNDKNSNRDDFEHQQSTLKGILAFQQHQRLNTKKSKTQFFIQQELSLGKEDTIRTEDIFQQSFQNVENNLEDRTKKINVVKSEFQNLVKRNKMLQEKVDQCLQKQYLLKTQYKHLEQVIRQKDKIIDKLNREKASLVKKNKNQSQIQIQKLQDLLQQIKKQLQKEMQRQLNLKQENTFLQNELIAKNQELILVYDKYSQLEYSCNQERKKMKQALQQMKIQVQKAKIHAKQQMSQFESFNQAQKLKHKLIQQQQQLKYLKIQNQCLLISKEQLHKSEVQVRKLKQQRDYFKRKVLDHVKRSKSKLSEISSSGGSILFELSEISIDL